MYGDWDVDKFTQRELNLVVSEMCKQKDKRTGKLWSVNYVNTRLEKIQSIFNWAYREGYITKDIPDRLYLAKKIEEGRTANPINKPKLAVTKEIIKKTLPFLRPVVRDECHLFLKNCVHRASITVGRE